MSAGKTWSGRVRLDLGPRKHVILIAAWLVLQTLDVVTTAIGLRIGLVEANALAAGLLARYGELAVYSLKALVTFAVIGIILLLQHRYARIWLGLKIVSVYMCLVVALNIISIALE